MSRRRITALVACVFAFGALVFVGVGAAKSSKQSATPFVACLVTDIGGLNDRGFNHLAYVGLLAAKAKLHATTYVLQSKSPNDYIPNFSTCVEQVQGQPGHRGRLPDGGRHPDDGEEVPRHEVGRRRHERQDRLQGRHHEELRGTDLRGERGRLRGRLHRRADGAERPSHHGQLRRRHPRPGGRPLHRGLPGRREEGRPEHPGAERLLAGLRGSGQVQEHRPRPDLEGL